MSDEVLRERLGKTAREKAMNLFSAKAMAKQYLELYQKMVQGR